MNNSDKRLTGWALTQQELTEGPHKPRPGGAQFVGTGAAIIDFMKAECQDDSTTAKKQGHATLAVTRARSRRAGIAVRVAQIEYHDCFIIRRVSRGHTANSLRLRNESGMLA
ncbi:hypothetical protein Scep_021966 [Stephania cephalantha]|uniref:Uncharacterized protein n=1 Tax=Stephania cephalantha TaxID=152367 RepID=A0AAP0F9Z5_9MAGN